MTNPLFCGIILSIGKRKRACQRAFSARFALPILAGDSPPAARKPIIPRKFIADRCEADLPRRNVIRHRKGSQGILSIFLMTMTRYGCIFAH